MKPNNTIFSTLLKFIFLICLLVFGWPFVANGQTAIEIPEGCMTGALEEAPPGQETLVCMPTTVPFNGVLVLYAHGYVKPQEILSLPFEEIVDFFSIIDVLQALGYAFAITSYSKNGYAVEQAGLDLLSLVNYFNVQFAETSKILLTGASEGGAITQMMIEKYPEKFAGGLAMCGPVAGMPAQINKTGDFFVIFNYFFPWVFPDDLTLSNPIENIFLSIQANWENYEEAIANAIWSHPLRTFRLFGITDTDFNWFDPYSFIDAAQLHLGRTIFGTLDMIDTASGMPFDNHDRWYAASWRLNRNVERVTGDPVAQEYVDDFYQPTGELSNPLVTIHNWKDPNVSFKHEEIYAQLVNEKGYGHNLTVLPIPSFGHCNFEPWQVLAAFFLLLEKTDD